MADVLGDGYIHVSYKHMENAADDMIAQTTAIRNTIKALEADLQPLVQTWYGNDAATYEQKQQAWNKAIEAAQQLLDRNRVLLENVSGNYRNTENKLVNLWAGN